MVTAPKANIKAIVAAALSCAAVLFSYGLTLEGIELALFAVILVSAAAVDIESRRIPNALVAAACVVRLAYLAILGLSGHPGAGSLAAGSLVGALAIGGGLLVATLVADRLFGGQNMGGGDIKLLAVVGLYFGVSAGIAVVLAACILGALSSRAFASSEASGTPQTFPFGPSIAAASVLAMLVVSPLGILSL